MPRRDHHVAAAGALHAFMDPQEIQRITAIEPTVVSTLHSRAEALKDNPHLPDVERALAEHGHRVAFGVDATRLHDLTHPATAALRKTAIEHGINLDSLEIAFLRARSEQHADDKALISSALASAHQSGVKKLNVTHSSSVFNVAKYVAPSEKEWVPAAVAAGFEHVDTTAEKRTRTVESVPRDDGVKTLQVRQASVSVFKALY